MPKKYYEILGIDESATPEEIKQAYWKLAKKWHPDKNNNSEESIIKFEEIRKIYKTLSDPKTREMYDFYDGKEWEKFLEIKIEKERLLSQNTQLEQQLIQERQAKEVAQNQILHYQKKQEQLYSKDQQIQELKAQLEQEKQRRQVFLTRLQKHIQETEEKLEVDAQAQIIHNPPKTN